MSPPDNPLDARPRDLFDRQRRAMRRQRCADGSAFIDQHIAAFLLERIDDVSRRFERALVIGARNRALVAAVRERCADVAMVEASPALAAGANCPCGDEDMLPVEPAAYDLVIWPGGMESVNALPDALLRCRFALRPDGLLIGAAVGEGSFAHLRQALQRADAPHSIARMLPQLTLRSVGDLLQQTGMQLVMTDIERMTLAYRDMGSVVQDLRMAAMTNVIAGPVYPLSKAAWAAANAAFAERALMADGGVPRVHEALNIILFSGWSPDPSQPQPAHRGSATARLSDVLGATPPPNKC